jgi:hypothetical protein
MGHVPQRQYTERGIKEIDGFMSERWRIEPEYAMKVDPSLGLLGVLLEPTTVVTKAWEQVAAIGQRAFWEPRTVLVTGAGPIGLLAALVGSSAGSRSTSSIASSRAPSPTGSRLGATYHTGASTSVGFQPDVIVECTGVGQVIADSSTSWRRRHRVPDRRRQRRPHVGLDRRRRRDDGAPEQRHRRQRQRQQAALVQGGQVLAQADAAWLARLLSRRESPEAFMNALPPPAGRHQGRHPVALDA